MYRHGARRAAGKDIRQRQVRSPLAALIQLILCASGPRPKISYPKPKTKARPPPERFIPGGARLDADDPRKASKKKVISIMCM